MTFNPAPENRPREDRSGVDKILLTQDVEKGLRPSRAHPATPAVGQSPIGWWSVRYTAVNADYVSAWQGYMPQVVHQSFFCFFGVTTTVGANGKMRLRVIGPGIDIVTAFAQLLPNDSRTYIFNWIHGLPLWTTLNLQILLQCKVDLITTPVADVIDVFDPYGGAFIQRSPTSGASSTGR